jgi:hypothetical protein
MPNDKKKKRKDGTAISAASAGQRDPAASPATGLTGSPPAAQPAAPVAAPAPPDSAGRADMALSRLKKRAKVADAGFLHKWVYEAFYTDPVGAIALFLERVEAGIAEGRYDIEGVLKWIKDPANERGIQLMLSMSVPGQIVFDHQLEAWKAAEVIEAYLNRIFTSAQGDVERLPQLLAELSLQGDALKKGDAPEPPAPAPVRRASLLPSPALYPTSPAACLQAPTERPASSSSRPASSSSRPAPDVFIEENTARQQRFADLEADAAARPRTKLLRAVVDKVNRQPEQWRTMSASDKSRWLR